MAFEVTILGCGSATPTSTHHPTAQLIEMAERFFLIDCGEGTQQQLRKYKLRMSKINHIFISHMHGDHYFGLIGLLSSYHLINRLNDLHVYGPPALQDVIDVQLKASATTLGYPLIFHVIEDGFMGLLLDDRRVEVHAFPLKHSMPVSGFLFKEKAKDRNIIRKKIDEYNIPLFEINKIKKGADFTADDGELVLNESLTVNPPKALSYAFCTDTLYMEKTADFVRGADVLYHESTFLNADINRARKTKHATALQAAKVAKAAGVKKLLLGHFSARYDGTEAFETEAKMIFENVTATAEGMRIIASTNDVSISF